MSLPHTYTHSPVQAQLDVGVPTWQSVGKAPASDLGNGTYNFIKTTRGIDNKLSSQRK